MFNISLDSCEAKRIMFGKAIGIQTQKPHNAFLSDKNFTYPIHRVIQFSVFLVCSITNVNFL